MMLINAWFLSNMCNLTLPKSLSGELELFNKVLFYPRIMFTDITSDTKDLASVIGKTLQKFITELPPTFGDSLFLSAFQVQNRHQ